MSARIDDLEVDPGDDVDLTIGFYLGGLRVGAENSRGMRSKPEALARNRAEALTDAAVAGRVVP